MNNFQLLPSIGKKMIKKNTLSVFIEIFWGKRVKDFNEVGNQKENVEKHWCSTVDELDIYLLQSSFQYHYRRPPPSDQTS